MPQRVASWLGLPASLHESSGQLPSKRRVGDSHDHGVSRGELFEPSRRVVDPRCLFRGRVPPAESQEQGSPTDCKRPRREREAKPTESGTFEIELAEQRRDDDLVPRRQQARRGDGTGSVAGQHEIGMTNQLLEMGRNAFVFADPCGFVGLTPRSEAIGGNPAGVDVRRAAMTNQGDGDATLCLNDALHTIEGTPDGQRSD